MRSQNNNRTHIVHVRLTDEEWDDLIKFHREETIKWARANSLAHLFRLGIGKLMKDYREGEGQ